MNAIGRGAVDLAYLGGASFARARHRHGAIPLAIRDVDAASTSAVIVPSGSRARSLDDLRGKSFAFGSEWSSSGAVMPRYFLAREGLDPGSAFSRVVFSGRRDVTVRMVADGEVAGGVVNAAFLLSLAAAGDVTAGRIRVLWRSPPFADSVWVARKELPAAVRQRLLDAFLDLDRSVPEHREALQREEAGGFLPASVEDWDFVADILARRGEL